MRDSELAERLADGSYRPPSFGSAPCNFKDCTHSGICLVNGLIYCGTHAWDIRYAGAVAL